MRQQEEPKRLSELLAKPSTTCANNQTDANRTSDSSHDLVANSPDELMAAVRERLAQFAPLWEDEVELIWTYVERDPDFGVLLFRTDDYLMRLSRVRAKVRSDAEMAMARLKRNSYWSKLSTANKRVEQQRAEASVDWFAEQLATRQAKPLIKLQLPTERAEIFLNLAYGKRVDDDRMQMMVDSYTRFALHEVARWMTIGTKNGIILHGGPGVGKSTMMHAIMDVYAIVAGKRVLEVSAKEVEAAHKENRALFRSYCDAEMLAIDDMGIESAVVNQYRNELTPIVDLIEERYKGLKFTIITTNLVEDERQQLFQLTERYGKRCSDRLAQMCSRIKYDGRMPSYRRGK